MIVRKYAAGPSPSRTPAAPGLKPRAFTLVEVAVGMVILALAMVALMQLMASITTVTSADYQTTLSTQYIKAGWEVAYAEGFDTVSSWITNPPTAAPAKVYLDAEKKWERRMWAEFVSPNAINGSAVAANSTNMIRLNVELYYNNKLVASQRWWMSKL